MNTQCHYDQDNFQSDCLSLCLQSCSQSQLTNNNCDTGNDQAACDIPECGWDMGQCGTCNRNCEAYAGSAGQLNNGVCDPDCNVEACNFDGGDCITSQNPLIVYVSPLPGNQSYGSWTQPYASLAQALLDIWAPFTTVYLLAGLHVFEGSLNVSSQSVRVTTLFCADSSHPQCASTPAVLQLSANHSTLFISTRLQLDNVAFQGGFALSPGCTGSYCEYCPAVHLNITSGLLYTDRNQGISPSQYADQALCDSYQDTVLIQISANSELTLSNVTFVDIRHQLKALILNECGDLTLTNVTFSNIMTRRLGLQGGVITQVVSQNFRPYYCGSFTYNAGLVELLNNGYEYSGTGYYSGFLALDAMHLINITNVKFQYNYMLIGVEAQQYGSALMYIQDFRQMQVRGCWFQCNLADTGSAFYIDSSLTIPIVASNGTSAEHALLHIIIENNSFVSNTGRKGAVILIQFHEEQQNVLLTNNTFIRNFATESAILELDNSYLTDAFRIGQNISLLVNGSIVTLFVPPVSLVIKELIGISNYAQFFTYGIYVANLIVTDSYFYDDGDSLAELDYISSVVYDYIHSNRTYMTIKPPTAQRSVCSDTFRVLNTYNSTMSNLTFDSEYCPSGSPGITVSGITRFVSTTQINLSNLRFLNSLGAGLLAMTVDLDITLSALYFSNNTNTANQDSVCINLIQASAADIVIANSTFIDNKAVSNTVANIQGAKSLILDSIFAKGNIASSTSAGITVIPSGLMSSFVVITNCTFYQNSALNGGVILITDTTGNMLSTSNSVTLTMTNSAFLENHSLYDGCSLTISGFVSLSQHSLISKSQFRNNICTEGGAAAFVVFAKGILAISDSTFSGNSGSVGSAISSTHHGSSDGGTYLSISNCEFTGHNGTSVIAIGGILMPLLITRNNDFEENIGSCVFLASGLWRDSNSVYKANSATSGGTFQATHNSEVSITDFTASNNRATTKGGACLASQSVVQCNRCAFTDNESGYIGGAVSIDQQAAFLCTSCAFEGNRALYQGSAIYSLFSSISLTNSLIAKNQAWHSGVIVASESHIRIANSEVSSNTAYVRSPGLITSLSNITIENSILRNHTGDSGSMFFTSVSNTLIILNSTLSQFYGNYGAVFYVIANSYVVIRDSHFDSCVSYITGAVASMRKSAFSLSYSSITRTQAPMSNGALHLVESTLSIDNSVLSDMLASAIVIEMTYAEIRASRFERITATYGAAVNSIDSYELSISDSVFIGNIAKQGGAIYSFTTGYISDQLKTVYTNNTFMNNLAVNGGTLYSDSVHVNLTNSRFFNNSASEANFASEEMFTKGYGGAVYLACVYLLYCQFIVEGNEFLNNTAEWKGGAIYWFDTYPLIQNNSMKGNFAFYGSDVASFPIRLALLDPAGNPVDYESNDTIPLVTVLTDIGSGHVIDSSMTIGLIDHYDHIVTTDSSSSARMISADSQVEISGRSEMAALQGVFNFSNFILKAKPESTQQIEITSAAVNTWLKKYTTDPNTYYPSVSVSLQFRRCLIGESQEANECYVCPPGTFSLEPSSMCSACPDHAVCYGNFTMTPQPGYWRPNPLLNLFFVCLYPSACIGSNASQPSLTGACDVGYSGNLCTVCTDNYSRHGKFQCEHCPSLASNITVLLLLILLALLIGVCVVIVAIRSASRPRSEIALYLKILMNYLQMVVVAASLNLNWPSFVSVFLNGQETAGSFADQLFSIECILQRISTTKTYYSTLIIYAVLPAVLIFLTLTIWLCFSICSKVAQIPEKLVATLVMILFILHPTLSKRVFSLFSCMEIEPTQYWLLADLSTHCWDSSHVKSILMISVPSLVVWIIGLPAICIGFLIRKRRALEDSRTQLMFSFLYKGYQSQWYYWEFVILYRKVALVCASVFLTTVSIMIQALAVLGVFLAALFFQLHIKPFLADTFNWLEVKSILVASITIYTGLFYQAQTLSET